MVVGDYKKAWALLSSVKNPSADLQFLMATCAMKQHNFHKAIIILNDIKRNQLNQKIKVRSLLMRMKVFNFYYHTIIYQAHKKMRKYEESLRDGLAVWALMS